MELTKEKIERNNYYAELTYKIKKKAIDDYENDSGKDYRLTARQCKVCYYLKNGLAFQAFTEYECQNCHEVDIYHNGSVPKYCQKCSEEFNVCRRCGAELDQ